MNATSSVKCFELVLQVLNSSLSLAIVLGSQQGHSAETYIMSLASVIAAPALLQTVDTLLFVIMMVWS